MPDLNQLDLAQRYFVTDLPSACVPATRLRNTLDKLRNDGRLSAPSLNYLQQLGLSALQRHAQGEITYEVFCETAAVEQHARMQAAEAEKRAKEAERKAREAAWAEAYERERQRAEEARRARESDPQYIAKVKSQQLRARYGLDQFIEPPFYRRVMEILTRIDGGNRLTDDDVLWLQTDGKDYYSDILEAAFHEREAEYFAAEYGRTSDPWNAVNASGHYRKCDHAMKADALLKRVPADRTRSPKLKSAICTTHGGVMRDLERLHDALKLGEQAHGLTPEDFRPCTLLGAVNIELGKLDIGWEWYRKAEERGASERSIDHDLRGIFMRADSAKREEIKLFLLRIDPERYAWVHRVAPGS